jgi:signal peptide peptidase SppA
MDLAMERICGAVFGRPHLYEPRKAETLIRALGPRITGHAVTIVNGAGPVDHTAFAGGRPSAGVLADRLGRVYDKYGYAPFDIVSNVAVIPVEGTLIQKGSWVGSNSGQTSYEGLQVQIERAARHSAIKGIVFEVDSFGGMINGAFETADAIRAASRAKPTIAILTDYAYSAGYLMASQARQIVMPEFGGAGSIGVVMMHADYSGNLEKEGIKVTFIHAGAHKVDGNPYAALPADVQAKWQAEVETARERFAATVGRGRGSRFTKAAALKTEAATFNAGEAVDMGLVDAIGDGRQAFAAFIKEVNRSS